MEAQEHMSDGEWRGKRYGKKHRETPSRRWHRMKRDSRGDTCYGEHWENNIYYATVARYGEGFPIGGGQYIRIGISSLDETARHDWRDFQCIKNDIAGHEWESVELYPAESRKVDPSNRFYLWCVPRDVFTFGWHHQKVLTRKQAHPVPQRPFPNGIPR